MDYLLADSNFWEKILEFKVLDPTFDSKRAPIMATPKLSTCKLGKEKFFNPPKSYKWSHQGCVIFKSILNLQERKKQITILREILSRDNIGKEIENITKSFAKVLTECADKSLKTNRSGKGKKKVKDAWYSKTCLEEKRPFKQLAKRFKRNLKYPLIYGQYQKVKKEYKFLMKSYRKEWELINIKKLTTLTENPKAFCSHLKTLRGKFKVTSEVLQPIICRLLGWTFFNTLS